MRAKCLEGVQQGTVPVSALAQTVVSDCEVTYNETTANQDERKVSLFETAEFSG